MASSLLDVSSFLKKKAEPKPDNSIDLAYTTTGKTVSTPSYGAPVNIQSPLVSTGAKVENSTVGNSVVNPLPAKKLDYSKIWSDKEAETARDNAIRSKTATNNAAEAAYRSGAKVGTADYQSFLQRSQAGADAANIDANAKLSDYGTQLATQQDTKDRADLQMELDAVGDNPSARIALVQSYLSGAGNATPTSGSSVTDTFSSLLNTDGTIKGAVSDPEKAIQARMEELKTYPENTGKSAAEIRAIAVEDYKTLNESKYRDQKNEQSMTETVDKVNTAVDAGDLSTLSNSDLKIAITNDDTGKLHDKLSTSAVASDGDGDQAMGEAAAKAGKDGFITDSSGTLYRVVSVSDNSGSDNGGDHVDIKTTLYDVDSGKSVTKSAKNVDRSGLGWLKKEQDYTTPGSGGVQYLLNPGSAAIDGISSAKWW